MSTKMAATRASKTAGATASGAHRTAIEKPRYSGDKAGKMVWAGLVAALLGLLVVAILINNQSDDPAAPLELSLGEGSVADSCLPFDVGTLAAMTTAFSGTVTDVADDAITLDVDRWYTGGDEKVVKLTTIADAQALVGGFPFNVGSQYLITGSAGAMNYCGYSGPAEPGLQSAFNSAFGG